MTIKINQNNIVEIFEKAIKKLEKSQKQCNVCGEFKNELEVFLGLYKSKMVRVMRICKKCQKGFIIK